MLSGLRMAAGSAGDERYAALAFLQTFVRVDASRQRKMPLSYGLELFRQARIHTMAFGDDAHTTFKSLCPSAAMLSASSSPATCACSPRNSSVFGRARANRPKAKGTWVNIATVALALGKNNAVEK